MRRVTVGLGSLALLLVGAGIGFAQSEEGVFSAEGVQIHTDARVHALFAVLNERGYDKESERGPEPTMAARYHALRQRLRDKLKLGQDVQKQADTFIASHPDNVVRYLRAALELGDAPSFDAPDGVNLGGYENLAKVLTSAWGAGAAEVYDNDVADYRKTHKDLLPKVDAMSADLRKLLRMEGGADEQFEQESDESGRVIVIYNPLDSHGTQLRHKSGKLRYVVLGPWKTLNDKGVMDPIIVEMARALIAPELVKVASTPPSQALFQRAGPVGSAFKGADEYLSEALSRVIARTILKRSLVLRTGSDADPELPAEADLMRAFNDVFLKGTNKLGDALPTVLAQAATPSATTEMPPTEKGPAVTPEPALDPKKATPATPVAPKPKKG